MGDPTYAYCFTRKIREEKSSALRNETRVLRRKLLHIAVLWFPLRDANTLGRGRSRFRCFVVLSAVIRTPLGRRAVLYFSLHVRGFPPPVMHKLCGGDSFFWFFVVSALRFASDLFFSRFLLHEAAPMASFMASFMASLRAKPNTSDDPWACNNRTSVDNPWNLLSSPSSWLPIFVKRAHARFLFSAFSSFPLGETRPTIIFGRSETARNSRTWRGQSLKVYYFHCFVLSASREQGPRLVSIKDEHARLLDENQKMKVSNDTLEVLLLYTKTNILMCAFRPCAGSMSFKVDHSIDITRKKKPREPKKWIWNVM